MMALHQCLDRGHLFLIGLILACSMGQAMAALGQAAAHTPPPSASLPALAAKKFSTTPVAQSLRYTLHEVQLENGVSIREYATPAGLVFAVSWRGPVLPDLNALLGDYFKIFKHETEQARMNGRRGSPVNIERDGLVVRSNGRMRNFFGHAYVPDLIPVGVDIKDVLE